MSKKIEIPIGIKYERLLVLEKSNPHIDLRSGKKQTMVKCLCDCGKVKDIILNSIKRGLTKSCGCLQKEIATEYYLEHGDTLNGSLHYYIFRLWSHIKDRCYNPNNNAYKDYGGRGIIMYEPWINNYQEFKKWILNNLGERPEGYSIDRIDNNKGYLPGNLRWADRTTQSKNRRNGKNNI